MRRSSRTVLLTALAPALLLLAVAPPAARAQAPKMLRFGLGGGVSLPVNHVKDTLKNGYVLQGVVSLLLPGSPFALRATANYNRFQGRDTFTTSAGVSHGTIISGLGNLSFYLIHKGFLQPYVSAGLGAFSVGTTTTVAGADSTDTKLHFGLNAAAGAEFHFSPSVSGYLEARLENVYTEKGFSAEVTDTKNIRVLPIVFGIMF